MFINRMGIELEGAWKGERGINPFPSLVRIKYDGSVYFTRPRVNDGSRPFLHYGEVVSDPLTPEELKAFAVAHCPTDVNDSCGTHIHVSLRSNALYGCLLTPQFYKELLDKYTEYNEKVIRPEDENLYKVFAFRLRGTNRYCKKGFKGLSQSTMDHKGSDRYHHLNYCHKLHGTVEIRVLPATTNPRVLTDLIDITVNAIEDWCRREHRAEKVRFRRQ